MRSIEAKRKCFSCSTKCSSKNSCCI